MRVVIGTNILISALIIKRMVGLSCFCLALQDKIYPQISTSLLVEYEAVMQRDKIQKLCILTSREQEELFHAYLSTCKWNEIFYLWRPNLGDKDDDFLVELAVASNSKVIITDNKKDVENGELQFDFEVLTPKEFLERKMK